MDWQTKGREGWSWLVLWAALVYEPLGGQAEVYVWNEGTEVLLVVVVVVVAVVVVV